MLEVAVIRCFPAMLDECLVDLARFFSRLGAMARTQGKGFPLAEKLDLHRPAPDLNSFALVGE
jgi:hypothetical protein